jgi:hypothetical protein
VSDYRSEPASDLILLDRLAHRSYVRVWECSLCGNKQPTDDDSEPCPDCGVTDARMPVNLIGLSDAERAYLHRHHL